LPFPMLQTTSAAGCPAFSDASGTVLAWDKFEGHDLEEQFNGDDHNYLQGGDEEPENTPVAQCEQYIRAQLLPAVVVVLRSATWRCVESRVWREDESNCCVPCPSARYQWRREGVAGRLLYYLGSFGGIFALETTDQNGAVVALALAQVPNGAVWKLMAAKHFCTLRCSATLTPLTGQFTADLVLADLLHFLGRFTVPPKPDDI